MSGLRDPRLLRQVLDGLTVKLDGAPAAPSVTSRRRKTPYDLRHAAVSTWLNGGVPPTTVAEWAGHSVEVLLRIYAKCLDGDDVLVRRRVQVALGYVDSDSATTLALN